MNWKDNSPRRTQLPGNWATLRRQILERDGHRCVALLHEGGPCGYPADQVDHIVRGNNHDPSNLQSLCAWHHKKKTRAEAQVGRVYATQKRPTGKHPGLI